MRICIVLQESMSIKLLLLCCSPFESVAFRLPDGLTRRGDINLLMLGDPGTAKSQLLKFVERCSPIGVGLNFHVLTENCFLFI